MFNSLKLALIALTAAYVLAGSGQQAEARNVPGSASAGILQLVEPATDDVLGGMVGSVRSALRFDGAQVSVRRGVGDGSPLTMTNFGYGTGDGGFVFGSLNYRRYELDTEVEADIVTGSLGFGRTINSRVAIFGAIIGESTTAETPFNNGTLDNTGVGLSFGLDYVVSEPFVITATAGNFWYVYDVTRNGGAVTGSFDSTRQFVDLRGSMTHDFSGFDLQTSFGVRYIRQQDSSYRESGGALVGEAEYERVVGFGEGRLLFDGPADFTPYLAADARVVGVSDDLPPGATAIDVPTLHGGLGFGVVSHWQGGDFDLGVRANTSEEGFTGYEAAFGINLRF
ncbi:hypothetical protein P1J78_21195 [Psychromarinibacter sp. C21-152]|uniref:Autotransporter domain-containing protein n=1 Tax=Psychromarinibacter sediminicola TaxID=3033385 RepID=A0AAE3NVZ8_9RHOB|nr:hypothetical protein [Psychromarinibacter sediminicola]MDF0603259.1 hypothetical protein [Psychromarinibacter sediminicola]